MCKMAVFKVIPIPLKENLKINCVDEIYVDKESRINSLTMMLTNLASFDNFIFTQLSQAVKEVLSENPSFPSPRLEFFVQEQ